MPITPACTTCCKPLFCPPLSGCPSCCCWHICVFSRGQSAGAAWSRGWKYVLGDVHGDQSGRGKVRPEFIQISSQASICLSVFLYLIIHLFWLSILCPHCPVPCLIIYHPLLVWLQQQQQHLLVHSWFTFLKLNTLHHWWLYYFRIRFKRTNVKEICNKWKDFEALRDTFLCLSMKTINL